MPRNNLLFRMAKSVLQYGISIKVINRGPVNGVIEWQAAVEPHGPWFRGPFQRIVGVLEGYRAGYLAGRKYTESELADLAKVIHEVDPRKEAVV